MKRQHLILLPGLVCDKWVWGHQLEFLRNIVDISIPPVDQSNTMQGLAEGVLATAPEEFSVAGFSMGGYIALEMLRHAPQRFNRIALLDTSAKADAEVKVEARKEAINRCSKGYFNEVIQSMLPVLLHPDHQKLPLTEFVTDMATRVGSDAFVWHGIIDEPINGRGS